MIHTFNSIIELLERGNVVHQVHQHVAVRTIAEAHAQVPELIDNLLKTVAFEIAKTSRRLLVAVSCDRAVDYKAVSAAVGCSRRALRLISAERVERELGFEVGGVGPFRVNADIEVLLDRSIADATVVKVGAGLRTRTLELRFSDLIRVNEAKVAVLSKSPGQSVPGS